MRNVAAFLRASAGYLWLIPAAAYLAFSAGQAMLRSYASEQETAALRRRLAEAKLERERLQAVLVYYHTDDFKEKELRRSLLLVRPDEKVYALPESSHVRALEDEPDTADSALPKTGRRKSGDPYWRQWVDYLI